MPVLPPSVLHWLRRNLFLGVVNSVLTVIFAMLFIWTLWSILQWAIFETDWRIVTDNLRFLLIGSMPPQAAGHLGNALLIVAAVLGILAGRSAFQTLTTPVRVAISVPAVILAFFLYPEADADAGLTTWLFTGAAIVIAGYFAPMQRRFVMMATVALGIAMLIQLQSINVKDWGGLALSFAMTGVVTVSSLIVGVFLALGRQSRWAGVRYITIGYIELIRSLPLILVVYWMWISLPLVLPEFNWPDIVRAGIAMSLFVSAYVAEYIRSGLQAIPIGQTEAAVSLGLSPVDKYRYIILPQAFRVVLPALVGNVLEIFNAVPLLFIIGSVDLLRGAQQILGSPDYSGGVYAMYSFLFAVYLLIGVTLSGLTRRMEKTAAQ